MTTTIASPRTELALERGGAPAPWRYLRALEAESIHILREAAAEFARPVLLYSIGKDSSVLLRLAQKAFAPGPIPFPLLHIDTGYKIPEMLAFRDATARELSLELIVHTNFEARAAGAHPDALGTQRYCAALKTRALLDALTAGSFDAAFGGARRDEEKSRAKERVYSLRDPLGQWDPRRQRPEPWNLFNPRLGPGETMRVFPLSNWTELDVWLYIHAEQIPVVPLYFARERDVVVRGPLILLREGGGAAQTRDAAPVARGCDQASASGREGTHRPALLEPVAGGVRLRAGESWTRLRCRLRSLGCAPCSGAIRSEAATVPEIIEEMFTLRRSERETRLIDHDEEGSMEAKKREGYF